MLHHFQIFHCVSPTKQGRGNISNISTMQPSMSRNFHQYVIFISSITPNQVSPIAPKMSLLAKGSSSKSYLLFSFSWKKHYLSGSPCHLFWVCNKNPWHWPSSFQLAFLVIISLERNCKIHREWVLPLGDSHC